jgi:hypothetical protein
LIYLAHFALGRNWEICCNPEQSGGDRMRLYRLKRRKFIALIGSAATVWPLAARTQLSAKPNVATVVATALD